MAIRDGGTGERTAGSVGTLDAPCGVGSLRGYGRNAGAGGSGGSSGGGAGASTLATTAAFAGVTNGVTGIRFASLSSSSTILDPMMLIARLMVAALGSACAVDDAVGFINVLCFRFRRCARVASAFAALFLRLTFVILTMADAPRPVTSSLRLPPPPPAELVSLPFGGNETARPSPEEVRALPFTDLSMVSRFRTPVFSSVGTTRYRDSRNAASSIALAVMDKVCFAVADGGGVDAL